MKTELIPCDVHIARHGDSSLDNISITDFFELCNTKFKPEISADFFQNRAVKGTALYIKSDGKINKNA